MTSGLRLDGRVCIVTGAGSGIGQGIAQLIAGLGGVVAVNDRDDATAQATVDRIIATGGTAFAVPGDITDEAATADVVERTVALGGRIDGLVNNAGITGPASLDDIDGTAWRQVQEVNLTAPFLMARRVVPHLRASGSGRIVNIASIAGTRVSVLGGAAYTASKAGLIGLTRHLAMELARDGITVNAVLPGVTMTPLVAAATPGDVLETVTRSVPVGRVGTPRDVGWATAFLLAAESSYISGIALEVDGALTTLPGNYEAYAAVRPQEVRA